jgi:signal transduction histidine kinase/ActR/RegA family two-component response regulator
MTMNLFGKKPHSQKIEFDHDLAIAQAEYLKTNLYIATIGTALVVLFLAYLFWSPSLAVHLMSWVCLSLFSTVFRLILIFVYRQSDCFKNKPKVAKKYLLLYTLATIISGLAFGCGWLLVIPHLSLYEQLIYLLTIVALLFGGLFSYSPFLPAYIAFSSTALWLSPLALDFARDAYAAGLAFGIWLISLVSTMFAIRFSTSFKTNKELELNVLRLLSEVTQKRDEAIDANLAKSRFLASVSHDLRQPMQAVSLSLNTLQQLILKKAGGEKAQQLVENNLTGLQHSVQYLNAMFEALLDISRLDAGALNVKLQFQSIEQLFKNLEFEYGKVAQEAGIRIEIATPKNFDKYQVKVDIHLLERLLRNLLTNAIRYTPKGSVRLAVRLKGNFIDIRVVDTGLGIPLGMRQKIFDEFIQLRNPAAKEKNVGMGLGLSIAKRLSVVLGSQIRLHSYEGLGSVFAFALPARRGLAAERDYAKTSAIDSRYESIDGALIIVIDDDPRICEATKTMLELHGAEAIIAESGDAAIQKMIFNSSIPDLILSDYRLFEETGLECIDKIRHEFNEDIPAVIITGDTAPDELKLLKEGDMEILYKPVPAEDLLLAIARNIGKLNR